MEIDTSTNSYPDFLKSFKRFTKSTLIAYLWDSYEYAKKLRHAISEFNEDIGNNKQEIDTLKARVEHFKDLAKHYSSRSQALAEAINENAVVAVDLEDAKTAYLIHQSSLYELSKASMSDNIDYFLKL